MATDGKYGSNSIIGKYIQSCQQARSPLSEAQISLLEKTINDAFGITKLPKLSADVFKPLDRICLKNRVRDILQEYKEKNLAIRDDLPLSEAEAWSLYSLTSNEIEKTTFKELKEKHNLPSNYGFTAYSYLHKYFMDKGYMPPKARLRMPKS